MKIIALERELPGATSEQFQPHLKAETVQVIDLIQADVLREIYFRQDRPEAVLVLECIDLQHAEDILGTLPLVQQGLITFDLIPLKPYPGFARLIGQSE